MFSTTIPRPFKKQPRLSGVHIACLQSSKLRFLFFLKIPQNYWTDMKFAWKIWMKCYVKLKYFQIMNISIIECLPKYVLWFRTLLHQVRISHQVFFSHRWSIDLNIQKVSDSDKFVKDLWPVWERVNFLIKNFPSINKEKNEFEFPSTKNFQATKSSIWLYPWILTCCIC